MPSRKPSASGYIRHDPLDTLQELGEQAKLGYATPSSETGVYKFDSWEKEFARCIEQLRNERASICTPKHRFLRIGLEPGWVWLGDDGYEMCLNCNKKIKV